MSTDKAHRRASRLAFEVALADAGGVSAHRERLSGLRAALLDELAAGAAQLELARSGYGHPVAVTLAVVSGRGPSTWGGAEDPASRGGAEDPASRGGAEDPASRGGAEDPASRGGARDPGSRGAGRSSLIAVAPVDQALRADAGAAGERSWLLTAALVGAMVQAGAASAPVPPGALEQSRGPGGRLAGPRALQLRAGALGEWLALAVPVAAAGSDVAELAVLAFEDESEGIDRLRARAYAVPAGVLDGVEDLRAPIGEDHPLRAAEAVARLGGRPADEASVAEHEEGVLAMLGVSSDRARPHAEQDPSLRAARRILQRLAGMGKWGGYHTDIAHLARGFAGNERALAMDVGELLVGSGLLVAKPSVGQRHVFLNPRRAGDIHALIERGVIPAGLELPGG